MNYLNSWAETMNLFNKSEVKKEENVSEKYKEQIKELTLLSDILITNVLRNNKPVAELILRTILNEPKLTIKELEVQKTIPNYKKRGVRLDMYAVDIENKVYNVEVQRVNEGASKRRARFNASLIDKDLLNPSEDFEKLPDVYVIFITERDVLGSGLAVYEIEKRIKQTGELFDDGSHVIYVNASVVEDTEIGRLMHDFREENANKMYNSLLAEAVRFFKEDKKGVEVMNNSLEKLVVEGKMEEKIETVKRFYKLGLSFNQIAQGTELNVEQVKEIISNMNNEV